MANALPNAAERARFRRYWLERGFLLPITSQAGALPPVNPLYTPCMPPVCPLYAPCMPPVCPLYAPCIAHARPWLGCGLALAESAPKASCDMDCTGSGWRLQGAPTTAQEPRCERAGREWC